MNAAKLPPIHIPILDSVRGFAAVWVMLSHSFAFALITAKVPIIGDGRAAVDVFMVLSGFLMVYLYRDLKSRNQTVRFYITRFFRISPLFYLYILCSGVWQAGSMMGSFVTLASYLTYFFGFLSNPIGGGLGWSITLEIQFYAIFPLLVLMHRKVGWFPIVFLAAAGSMLAHSLWTVYTINPPGVLGNFVQPSLLPFKLPLFLLGAFFADPSFFKSPAPAACLLGINLVGVLFPAAIMTGYKSSVCIYAATVVVVIIWRSGPGLLQPVLTKLSNFLTISCFRITGDISYGIFLLHGFVFHFVSGYLQANLLWLNSSPLFRILTLWSLCIPLVYLLSWVAFRIVEAPCIQFGKQLGRKLFPDPVVS